MGQVDVATEVECFPLENDDKIPSGIYVLRLNRPDKLNALTESMGDQFRAQVERLRAKTDARALILTGAGRAFSSGGDLDFLQERAESEAEANSQRMRSFYERFLCIRDLAVPTIAAIQGPAIGAGLCLALACDIRIAANDAKLGFTFVKLGLHPGMAASHLLPAVVGHQIASRLLLTGDVIRGDEAMTMGLVAQTTSTADTFDAAVQMATRIAAAGPVAVRTCVRSLRLQQEAEMERALWREADAQAHCYATQDLREGIQSLRERRQPVFRGI